MNTLNAGFARVNITPPLGVTMPGYYRKRQAEGITDELESVALALACGETKVVLIAIDHLGVIRSVLNIIRQEISEKSGVPCEAIFIHSTHTHTGPAVDPNSANPADQAYYPLFVRKVVDSAILALKDLQPARMGFAISDAPNVAFIRRFYMKDGSVKTNPSKNDPDIIGPVGQVDERLNVLRFDRENDSIILGNFGNHPDTVGGKLISADWPGLFRNYVEKTLDNTKCIFFNGVQGDVNHENRSPEAWYESVPYAYRNAQRIARVLLSGVLRVYDKMHYVDVDNLKYIDRIALAPANKADPEQLPEAHRISELYLSGQKHLLPYPGTMLQTTIIAEAQRMVRLENAPDFFELPMIGIGIGPVAFIGLPGEPFTGIGVKLKEAEGWEMVMPTCNTNGKEGYFPMMDAFEEGGYEARSSNFKPGVAELLYTEGLKILNELREA